MGIYAEHRHYRLTSAIDVDDVTGLARPVALLAGVVETEEDRQAWAQERGRWLRAPVHRGLNRCLRAIRMDGQDVLVLDYVFGPSLAELVRLGHQLSVLEAANVLHQAGRSLRFLHNEHGMVHGGIEPDGVLWDGSGRIVLGLLGHCEQSTSATEDVVALCESLRGACEELPRDLLEVLERGCAGEIRDGAALQLTVDGVWEPLGGRLALLDALESDGANPAICERLDRISAALTRADTEPGWTDYSGWRLLASALPSVSMMVRHRAPRK